MSSKEEKQIPLWRVVISVIQAALGVQSGKNRERDFSKGRPAAYIIAGLIFTIVFILVLYGVVKMIMHFAGV